MCLMQACSFVCWLHPIFWIFAVFSSFFLFIITSFTYWIWVCQSPGLRWMRINMRFVCSRASSELFVKLAMKSNPQMSTSLYWSLMSEGWSSSETSPLMFNIVTLTPWPLVTVTPSSAIFPRIYGFHFWWRSLCPCQVLQEQCFAIIVQFLISVTIWICSLFGFSRGWSFDWSFDWSLHYCNDVLVAGHGGCSTTLLCNGNILHSNQCYNLLFHHCSSCTIRAGWLRMHCGGSGGAGRKLLLHFLLFH